MNSCIKNDLRNGKYVVGSNLFNQVLHIKPDYQIDMFKKIKENILKDDVVYLDPPHMVNVKSGIMYQKYTSLDNINQIKTLAYNCNLISDKFLIIKWNDLHLDINSFLDYFRKYFIDTIKFGDRKKKNTSWLIIMIKKEQANDLD